MHLLHWNVLVLSAVREVGDHRSMLVQGVHVKNRCAFLNHSSAAMDFMQLVEQYPNIALWFSVSHISRSTPQQCSP